MNIATSNHLYFYVFEFLANVETKKDKQKQNKIKKDKQYVM